MDPTSANRDVHHWTSPDVADTAAGAAHGDSITGADTDASTADADAANAHAANAHAANAHAANDDDANDDDANGGVDGTDDDSDPEPHVVFMICHVYVHILYYDILIIFFPSEIGRKNQKKAKRLRVHVFVIEILSA